MAIQVKHTKVSTVPDDTDTSLVRPSDWNADHTLVGTIDVPNGGTGASTLTGYVKGNGTSAMTASATVPSTDITGLGTMSTQNANAVAITGGTINGTTIGATSATTVNATTLSGQTGVLRGTGTNLLLQSQTFDNASWTKGNTTITAASITAPDGTLTGQTFTAVASGPTYFVTQNTTFASLTQTFSIYLKAGTITSVQLYCYATSGGTNTYTATFNISAGTVTSSSATGTSTLSSATITSVGNGWYRCILAGNVNSTGSQGNVIYTGNGNFYAWGSQLEVGNTANTYIPTTTTAVYGTPTLSFSGVSTLGLESNGALFLQPAGTGAIQAQATTSTTAGGNARGQYAVDWQTSRNGAAQVASSTQSVVGGGFGNTASNVASTVAGGAANVVNQPYGGILSGQSNAVTLNYASVVGGSSNTGSGYYGFVGGGTSNSTTSSSAVTTQSATMNGTTAVTLSGSNANIKVGQMITGTSITFPNTYVAGISGTSLTLSQNASGSSTSTLSFFTPHGVVVGGGNNQATGAYSFIGGGGDAGTAANRNVASGDWSFVGGGIKNVASGIGSVVLGGGINGSAVALGNTSSAVSSFIGAGQSNAASGNNSVVVGGLTNTANATQSVVIGGAFGVTRSIIGNHIFSACSSPIAGSAGVSQSALLVLGVQTTDATATALRSDTSAAGTTNQVILPNNSAYLFKATVISNVTGGGNTSAWKLEGAIKRGANAASTTIVGLVTTTLLAQDAGAATWAIAATADTTNGGLRITFTGQASTTIRTVCKVETTEVTF